MAQIAVDREGRNRWSIFMDNPADPRWPIAKAVSAGARARLEVLRDFIAGLPPACMPETLADFDAAVERGESAAKYLTLANIAAIAPIVSARVLGGVTVLDVRAPSAGDDTTAIVYVHGGGFVQGSARSSLLTAAVASATSGRPVISIDYTLAPRGNFRSILQQVAAVWGALLSERPSHGMGLIGDSAGGCIAAAATLLLRDRGVKMPGALVLLSPVTDLAGDGDTATTLAAADYLDARALATGRAAYAQGADLANPLVSPVHGDFTRGYPPVLMQAGTREMLLSDSVRLHRALRAAGQESRLELYEGMPHVFQPMLADAPEGQAAWAEIAAFWTKHLRP